MLNYETRANVLANRLRQKGGGRMVLTITFQVTDLSIIGTVATVLSSMFGAVGCYIGYLT